MAALHTPRERDPGTLTGRFGCLTTTVGVAEHLTQDAGVSWAEQGGSGVSGTASDCCLRFEAMPKGWLQEKVEGVAVAQDGSVFIVTDNDGVDGNTGETQFLRIGSRRQLGF